MINLRIKGGIKMDNEFMDKHPPKTFFEGVTSLVLLILIFGIILILLNQFLYPIIKENIENEYLVYLRIFSLTATSVELLENEEVLSGVGKIYKDPSTEIVVVETVVLGYAGDIKSLVGIDKEGKVIGVMPIDNNETATIGGEALDQKYLANSYSGLTIQNFSNYEIKGKEEYPVDVVAGATITSKAMMDSVFLGLDSFEKTKK